MISFDLLTGFLGSGKTTLLNAFLRTEAGADTAVIVNEFGAIGLDQLLYKEVSEDVYLLDSGCLCCTVTHSLRETLLEIKGLAHRLGRPELRRVVVETTGLADPLPVLHALLGDKTLMQHYRLGHIITTVDAMQGAEQLAQHKESQRQAGVADQLVITKADRVEPAQLLTLQQQLLQINPGAKVTVSSHGLAAAAVFTAHASDRQLQLLPSASQPIFSALSGSPRVFGHSSTITSWSTFLDVQPTWAGVAAWWNLLTQHFGTQLLRCKGLLQLSDPPSFVLIQGVGKVFHTPTTLAAWPDKDPRSRLVCIGTNLDPVWLQASLKAFLITEPSSKPRNLAELNDCF